MIITFKYETKYGAYSDALHLDDNHTFTEDEIEDMKQKRLDNWIAYIESPKDPIQPILVNEEILNESLES
jgi:hypothetical protein